MPQSELMHTARQGKWPPPWLLFPWQGDSVVIALRDKSHCSLSSPVVHSQIRGCFQAGFPVLEACGLMVTITAWTRSIPVAWHLGSRVFLVGFQFSWHWNLSSHSLPQPSPKTVAIPSLFVCFLWWLRFALWDTSFFLFPNSNSKSLANLGRGWLISLYQLSKVMPLMVDIWRKLVIRLEMWTFQLRCFCYAS